MPRELRPHPGAVRIALLAIGAALGASIAAGEGPARIEIASPGDRSPSIVLTADAASRLGIETVVVANRSVGQGRDVGGELIVPSGGEITLAAPVAGVLLRAAEGRFPAVGDRVRRGQLLFLLLGLPADRDLLTARQESARAEARLTLASAKAKRAQQLLESEAGSVRQVEEAAMELADASAAAATAIARLQLISGENLDGVAETLGAIELRAPESAVVRAVHVAAGQSLAASTPLIELVRLDRLWVRVPIYAGDAQAYDLSRGARIRGLSAPPSAPAREARPISVPLAGDPRASSIDLYFELSNTDGALRPGQRVRVTLARHTQSSGLTVPSSAIVYDVNGESWVYVRTEPETFSRRPVEIAAVDGGETLVTRGLSAGTEVVTVGAAELYGVEFYAPSAGPGGGH